MQIIELDGGAARVHEQMEFTHANVRHEARRALKVEIAGLSAVAEALEGALGDELEKAVDVIFAAPGRVIVTGMGKSGHIGRKIAATLASTGTPAHFVHPAEASHGDLGMIGADDVILALSWSGETSELGDMIHYSRRYNVRLIAITSGVRSSLARAAEIVLLLPKVEEACPLQLAPTTSTLITLALGDSIAMALLRRHGFTPEHFRQFHPGGKLGAQLLTVGDLMHKGDGLPLISETELMGVAIITMTGRNLGCVIVTDGHGDISGIVTDGDLRRHMDAQIFGKSVASVMTKSPTTTSAETLAATALLEMNNRKISVLPVVSDGKPVGALHIQDLLSAGVV